MRYYIRTGMASGHGDGDAAESAARRLLGEFARYAGLAVDYADRRAAERAAEQLTEDYAEVIGVAWVEDREDGGIHWDEPSSIPVVYECEESDQ